MNSPVPGISVVIPLYNKASTIERALDSVLRQTVGDFDVIVIDDGSTDGGAEIVGRCDDDRVRLVSQENRGVSAARNQGIRESRSDVIAFLDADDEWAPEFLEAIMALRDRFPDCSVYATSYTFRDESGVEQEPLKVRFASCAEPFQFENYFEAASVSSPPIAACSVAVRREALDAIDGFPEGIAAGEDLLAWARLASEYDIAYDPRSLAVYWRKSLSWNDVTREPEDHNLVGEGLRALLNDSRVPDQKKRGLRRYIATWEKIRASHGLASGNTQVAISSALHSIRYYPFNPKVWLYLPFALIPTALRRGIAGWVEARRDNQVGRM